MRGRACWLGKSTPFLQVKWLDRAEGGGAREGSPKNPPSSKSLVTRRGKSGNNGAQEVAAVEQSGDW